jgi:hypothetical protein
MGCFASRVRRRTYGLLCQARTRIRIDLNFRRICCVNASERPVRATQFTLTAAEHALGRSIRPEWPASKGQPPARICAGTGAEEVQKPAGADRR